MGTDDWFDWFDGDKQLFTNISDLEIEPGELFVAVGTMAVELLDELPQSVRKARYCHGFSDHLGEIANAAWAKPMTTISVSPALVERLERLSGQRVAAVVPNGIRANQYYESRAFDDPARNCIGTIYNSNPKKDPESIIAIVNELRRRAPEVPILVFGARRKPRRLNCSQYWPNANVSTTRDIYNRCAVWFLASKSEGFGLPLLEAMACGAAVVSSNHDTAAGIVEEDTNGRLVAIGDVNGFCASISSLMVDDRERRRLVENGRRTVERFTWERSVRLMEEFLSRQFATPA